MYHCRLVDDMLGLAEAHNKHHTLDFFKGKFSLIMDGKVHLCSEKEIFQEYVAQWNSICEKISPYKPLNYMIKMFTNKMLTNRLLLKRMTVQVKK